MISQRLLVEHLMNAACTVACGWDSSMCQETVLKGLHLPCYSTHLQQQESLSGRVGVSQPLAAVLTDTLTPAPAAQHSAQGQAVPLRARLCRSGPGCPPIWARF